MLIDRWRAQYSQYSGITNLDHFNQIFWKCILKLIYHLHVMPAGSTQWRSFLLCSRDLRVDSPCSISLSSQSSMGMVLLVWYHILYGVKCSSKKRKTENARRKTLPAYFLISDFSCRKVKLTHFYEPILNFTILFLWLRLYIMASTSFGIRIPTFSPLFRRMSKFLLRFRYLTYLP